MNARRLMGPSSGLGPHVSTPLCKNVAVHHSKNCADVADGANSTVMENQGLPIIDCHQHFIDSGRLRYPVFMQRSAGFEALIGDYSALPRVYLPEDYARDVNGLGVVKTVWRSSFPTIRWAR
jgi:hypothetical protein